MVKTCSDEQLKNLLKPVWQVFWVVFAPLFLLATSVLAVYTVRGIRQLVEIDPILKWSVIVFNASSVAVTLITTIDFCIASPNSWAGVNEFGPVYCAIESCGRFVVSVVLYGSASQFWFSQLQLNRSKIGEIRDRSVVTPRKVDN